MAHDKHLREKAIYLRTEKHMTLDEIIERLSLPRTTIYEWIKDIPIPRTNRQSEAQQKGTLAMQAKFAAIRDQAYQHGWEEAQELLRDPTFRDFVVLYMAEGLKRHRNRVAFVNSDPAMVKIAYKWMQKLTPKTNFQYRLQYHVDQNADELREYWGKFLSIQPEAISILRKSNSGQLSGRQFRSVYGLLTIEIGDTNLRARLQAWMDFIKTQW